MDAALATKNPVIILSAAITFGGTANSTKMSKGWGEDVENTTESPALKNSPYNPDVVEARIKPNYKANPAHDPNSPLYNPKKGPEPADASEVYKNAVPGDLGTWYGVGKDGKIYRYFYDGVGETHFSGYVTKEQVPKSVRTELGIKY